jgi:hypothetical protein
MDVIKNITTNFCENHRVENYSDIVAHFLQPYEAMG